MATEKRNKKKNNNSKGFMYKDITNVQHEVYDYTGNNWSHRKSNKRYLEKYGSHIRKNSVDTLLNTAMLET